MISDSNRTLLCVITTQLTVRFKSMSLKAILDLNGKWLGSAAPFFVQNANLRIVIEKRNVNTKGHDRALLTNEKPAVARPKLQRAIDHDVCGTMSYSLYT